MSRLSKVFKPGSFHSKFTGLLDWALLLLVLGVRRVLLNELRQANGIIDLHTHILGLHAFETLKNDART